MIGKFSELLKMCCYNYNQLYTSNIMYDTKFHERVRMSVHILVSPHAVLLRYGLIADKGIREKASNRAIGEYRQPIRLTSEVNEGQMGRTRGDFPPSGSIPTPGKSPPRHEIDASPEVPPSWPPIVHCFEIDSGPDGIGGFFRDYAIQGGLLFKRVPKWPAGGPLVIKFSREFSRLWREIYWICGSNVGKMVCYREGETNTV